MRLFSLFILFSSSFLLAQRDTSFALSKGAYHGIMTGSTAGSLLYLHLAWYSSYFSPSFHYFNDWDEWMQMDKAGHLFTSCVLASKSSKLASSAGYTKPKAFVWGGIYSLSYMTGLEILDGFSEGWGFSWGDYAFDLLGIGLYAASFWLDTSKAFLFKFSFWPSIYAQYNPKLLGKSLPYQVLKDYNGQTYWLTFRPAFLSGHFPRWLGISFGYGADGMVGASYNPETIDGNSVPYFERKRQYFLSLDIVTSQIPVKNKILRAFLHSINIIKFPAPALEMTSKKQFYWHWLYL
jgi:uncharacterized protein YfiM (DUF2279 family)